MSPENHKQILTAHDLSNLRTLQSVATTAIPVSSNNNNNNHNNNTTNMVLSTIPLDGHAVVIQQSHLVPTTTISATQQQRAAAAATTSNGFNSTLQNRTTANSISNLIAATTLQPTTKATIINASSNNSMNNSANNIHNNSSNNCNNNNNGMHSLPASSKYVFLQQNGNGQYTTYEGTTSTTANNVGNIVLLATEPMELSANDGSETHVTVTGDNDEELRPLSWLNDKNLIKGIVTSSGGNAATAAGGHKRPLNSNICIVNANGTHEYIEELPSHVACEEHVTTIGNSNKMATTTMSLHDMPETQITTLSVSDFQQQFISSNKHSGNSHNHSSSNNSQQQMANLANFALAQEAVTEQQHIYNNIATLGATTTVHVGPSGTTTVVEYKSNSNFIPNQRQLINGITSNNASTSNNNSNSNNIATTIMATNNSNNNHNHNHNYNHNQNTYVPSSTSTASSTSSSTAAINSAIYASACSPHATPLKQTITLPNNVNTVVVSAGSVVNGNNTTNPYYQQQQQQQQQPQQKLSNSNNNYNNNNSNSSSTTHHPHKKYLREKMNGLDQTAGIAHNNNSSSSGSNSAVTSVVSSPASSASSGSSNSTLSSSLSTGAVNGANSPVSKSSSSAYYTLIGGVGSGVGIGVGSGSGAVSVSSGSHNNNNSGGGGMNYSNAFVSANTTTTSPPNTSYTILNQSQNIISNAAAMSSPESSTKDYYAAQHQPQHHIALKSPKSYSSYENDSLKDFEISTPNSGRLTTSTPQQQQTQHHSHLSHSPTPMQHHQKTSAMSPTSSTSSSTAATPQKQKHPNNVPYDPLVHTHNKPPYSFSSLIFMAIEGSVEKALPVKEIYAWIVQHFPYFKTAPTGWKNSVRHNLSLNKSFVKVEKAPNMGKGSLWRVEQQQRQNLIQALTRSPFFPNSAVDKINLKSAAGYDTIDGSSPINMLSNGNSSAVGGAGAGMLSGSNKSCIDARFDARLFPKLSKVFKDMEEHNALNDNSSGGGVGNDMADEDIPSDYSTTNNKYQCSSASPMQQQQQQQQQPQNGVSAVTAGLSCYDSIDRLARDCGADSIDDVNAATAMLALKHGPKVFAETFQNGAPVITSSPSEDHTYSAGGGGGGGVGGGGGGGGGAVVSGAANNLNNGNSVSNGNAINGLTNGQNAVCGDNQSNCASSDAAYESSEENHNITPEELADQQRHRDGVDALLSLSSFMDGSSPIKRPPSNTVEEEHISSCLENVTPTIGVGKMALMSINTAANQHVAAAAAYHLQQQHHPQQHHNNHIHHHHHSILDEGYNTQSYYGSNNNSNSSHYMASPSTPKKPKPLRNLRAKIKRKTTWIR